MSEYFFAGLKDGGASILKSRGKQRISSIYYMNFQKKTQNVKR